MIKLSKTLMLLALLSVVTTSAQAAKRTTRTKVVAPTIVAPLYDTVRVVVYDTIRVEPKAAPRIDTLCTTHTPAEIDSLADVWQTMMAAQGERHFFGDFSAPTTGEEAMAVDSLYRKRLQDMANNKFNNVEMYSLILDIMNIQVVKK